MSPTVVFNPSEIIEACNKAKADGGERPLAKVFFIEETARSGPNGSKYMGLFCTTASKKRARLMVRFTKEKHVGQIPPLDDAEVARINAERGDKYGVIKKRDRNPTINFQKYPVKVETDDQGCPKGALPDKTSAYYAVVALVDEFFYEEMQARLADGRIILRDARRKNYPANVVVVPSTKIVPMIQTHVSMEAKVNPGSELANPICRINMKFDKDTGMAKKAQYFDFTKPYHTRQGKCGYEPLTFDGHPVSAHNVHKIGPHSIVSGIANLNAVCASIMGLSVPTGVEILVVEPPLQSGVGIDDVFEDGMFGEDAASGAGAGKKDDGAEAAAAAPAAKAAEAPAPAAVSEDSLAGVLDDLGVGDE